jgi:hypothetical protein
MLDTRPEVKELMEFIKEKIVEKLKAQGHDNTGNLIESIEIDVENISRAAVGNFYMEDYYIFLEDGVKNVPYTRGGGSGGFSQYIKGLIKWWRSKGLNNANSRSAAFATANKHSKEGMPTNNAYRFSKDGTRLNFLSDTLAKHEEKMLELFERNVGTKIELIFTNVLNQISQNK